MSLSDAKIRTLKPTDKPFKVSDSHGLYLLIKPMTAAVLAGRTQDTAGTASAIHTTFRQTGSLMGIALAGLIFSRTQHPVTVLMGLSALVHLLLALMNTLKHTDIT